MRPGLTTFLWRRLSCAAPCYCASSCYGTVWRTLKSNNHQLWLQYPDSTLLLPCCSTILQKSRLLHTTSPAQKTRRFFVAKPIDTLCDSLRRPRKVSSNLESGDVDYVKTLEIIKQATAFLKKEEALSQLKAPTAPATPNLNTSQQSTLSNQKFSAPSVESQSANVSSFLKKEARSVDSGSPNSRFFNVEGRDQNFDSSYRSKTTTANYFSSEKQVFGQRQAVDAINFHSGSLMENEVRAPENRSTEFFPGRGNNKEHQPEGKEGDCDGEFSNDRQRFRRRYSRNRFSNNSMPSLDLPANTMEKIKEATHLLRHGTLSSNLPSSLSEQCNTTGTRRYFFQESTTREITPAVEPDSSTKSSLSRHQGIRAMKGSPTPDSNPNSPILDELAEGILKKEASSLTSFIKDAFSNINKELPKTTHSSLGSSFSTINEEPPKIPHSSLGSTREEPHAAASSASSTRPLARSVPLSTPYARQVPRTAAEQLQLMKAPVVSPPNSRLLRVALLGLPNSGKSTLVNALLEDRVCSVSNKANTTRCLARAIYTTEDTQLVFLDTPGVVTPQQTIKHRLVGSVVQDAERSLAQADLLLLLHDCASPFNRLGLHPRLLRVLALYPHIPAILVMNKVDLVKPKQHLLKMTRLLTEGVVGGRSSHGATPSSRPRDPFRDVSHNPDALVKSFLDSLERTTPEDEGREEDELPEPDARMEATQQTQQVSFERLMSNKGPVVLPCLETVSMFHVKASVSDEDVLSGRVKLSEQQLAAFIEGRKGWPYFERVLLTSALTGNGVMDLRQVLEDSAVPAPWQYPDSMITDQDPYQLATLTVREKFMDKFKYQLPYNLRFEVDNWELGDADSLIIRIRVICEETGLVKYLVGANGCHIKTLRQQAEQKLGQIFKADVTLHLIVSSLDEKPRPAEETRRNEKKARDQS